MANHRFLTVDLECSTEHQFLPIARQFTVDEYCCDHRRHQHHGGQHIGARRLRVRLSRIPPVRRTISAIPHGEDNYTLAANLGVTTRIENMATATQALMTTASTIEATNNVAYKMAIYTFNGSGTDTVQTLTSNLNSAATAASCIDVLEVYNNNCLTKFELQQRHRH